MLADPVKSPHPQPPHPQAARPQSPHPQAARPRTVNELSRAVLAGSYGPPPQELAVTSAFWLHNTTRLVGGEVTYRNHYLLLRSGDAFGACSFEAGELVPGFCANVSGRTLDTLIRHGSLPVRIAALDAYLARVEPHRGHPAAEPVTLPSGTPEARAHARDAAIAGLLDITPGAKVALIGVVNPLVAAIRERGGVCLPCDLNLRTTQWGDPVATNMAEVLEAADAVVATGMTLSNGSFDLIVEHCRARGIPLVVYAQSGSAVARAFLGAGVSALSAEPFPFSQFSADETTLHRYRAAS
ncbi:Rossmann-like domain-containing protein [Streptomyces sp. A5-4]|uniref:Rossmann-like domain-containing protein n=1 Tax=Streptomyces sp. A5-4 TaxID=3384771 RepID=UPI003DA7CEA7